MINFLTPVKVLTIYDGEGECYIEYRKVRSNGSLSAPRPLRQSTLRSLGELLYKKNESMLYIDGIIDPRVLHISFKSERESVTWLIPPSKRKIYFKEDLGIESKEYPTPWLVFQFERPNDLDVYAIKSGEKDIGEATLHNAPYPNISSHNVCMGNAGFLWDSPISEKKLINDVTSRFFNSEFTHHASEELVKGNYTLMMKSMGEEFPEDKLVKTKKTINDIIKK